MSAVDTVKEKTRESVDSLFRINERVARVDSAITNQHLSSDFYDLKHFAHVDCFKWKLNFKQQKPSARVFTPVGHFLGKTITVACLCRSFWDLCVNEVAV